MKREINKFNLQRLVPGAVVITVVEDDFCLEESFFHNENLGFRNFIFISREVPALAHCCGNEISISWQPCATLARTSLREALNGLIAQLVGRWVFYGFNSEFLFFPQAESRSIEDLACFMEEERRSHVFSCTIDLYGSEANFEHLNKSDTYFDASGYYAMNRFENGEPLDRQIEVFGGLKWRYSEHVPWDRQRIDRVPFFKVEKGLELGPDFRLNDPELNTHSCPWHHNVTCAIASYRTAKSLRRNPGSAAAIGSFMWNQSRRFEWSSKQLMDLGMMEPGQWF